MSAGPLPPLRFEPAFKPALWGGRRLPAMLNRPAPTADPIGEAWVLSDVDGTLSRVADGPLAGATLRDLLAADPARILGPDATPDGRFPLLLKFIDACHELSVQVHPNDAQAERLAGPGRRGKTEAWVILDADPVTSRLYAGFAEGMTAERFRAAMGSKTVPDTLHRFTPAAGDCLFLEAGTVHAIGAHVLVFEVQQTSDITYRLYDWDRVDAKTGLPRQLHIQEGLECADFGRGPCRPVRPGVNVGGGVRREGLVACRYFTLDRLTAREPFRAGAKGRCRMLVGIAGRAELDARGGRFPIGVGDAVLLPAELGECLVLPAGDVTLLECGISSA